MVNLPPLLYSLLHTVGCGKKRHRGERHFNSYSNKTEEEKEKARPFIFPSTLKKKKHPATYCESVKSQGASFSDPPPHPPQ